MARKTSISNVPSNADKLTVPGVIISDLLEFEDLFPDIRFHLATLMLSIVTIAQIRVTLSSTKPTIIQSLSSVNLHNRLVLSKSYPLLYTTSAVAIRRTAVAYAQDTNPQRIVEDHHDLYENTSGAIITRGGIAAHVGDQTRLRAYRRGIMAQTTGEMQSTPMHLPRRIARDVEKVSPSDFLSRLPFPTADIAYPDILERVNSLISPKGELITCSEQPTVAEKSILLEDGLLISRSAPVIPDISKAPSDLSKLPAWQRAAIKQAQSLGGGT